MASADRYSREDVKQIIARAGKRELDEPDRDSFSREELIALAEEVGISADLVRDEIERRKQTHRSAAEGTGLVIKVHTARRGVFVLRALSWAAYLGVCSMVVTRASFDIVAVLAAIPFIARGVWELMALTDRAATEIAVQRLAQDRVRVDVRSLITSDSAEADCNEVEVRGPLLEKGLFGIWVPLPMYATRIKVRGHEMRPVYTSSRQEGVEIIERLRPFCVAVHLID
jgi:hypothetical protein